MRSRKGSISPIVLQVGELLPRGGIFNEKRRGKTELNIFTESLVVTTQPHLSLHRPFQARSRGCVQTKTSEGGRIRMRADYYYFAPTGGSHQGVFRGTLPRRTASGVRSVVIARRYFFVGHCRGDTTSNYRNVAITRRHHKPISTTFVATLLSTCLSCAVTARRTST